MVTSNKFNIFFYTSSSLTILLILIILAKNSYFDFNTEKLESMPSAYCNTKKSCTSSSIPGRTVQLSLVPVVKLPNLTRIEMEVQTKNIKARQVSVDLSGVNKYMIDNKPPLNPTSYNSFRGSTVIPSEVIDGELKATVYIDTDSGKVAIPFRYDIEQMYEHLDEIQQNTAS